MGLSLRVFAMALIDFLATEGQGDLSVDFVRLLKGAYSPGIVFRLDELQLRVFVEALCAGPLKGALRFVDTADTQSLVLNLKKLDPQYQLRKAEEAYEHA